MDVKTAKKNIIVSVICKVIILVLSIVSRRFLIQYGGNALNGLNALYSTIITFLSVVELGVGTAISYCMYAPIVKGDTKKVSALYCLFKKLYAIIGLVILGLGAVLLPLLPYLAKEYVIDGSARWAYILCLCSAVMSYFYAAKISLINAYKSNFITTAFSSASTIIIYPIQILIIVYTQSFVWFSAVKILGAGISWAAFSVYSKSKYRDIIKEKEHLDSETKNDVKKNVFAMFYHKIGDTIFASIDSFVISAMISVIVLGYYSNYFVILSSMNEIIKLFIIPLTSVLGHMNVEANVKDKRRYFSFFYGVNFILGIIFYLGYYSIAHNLINLFFGKGLLLENKLLILLTVTYFIQFMRQSASVFKDSFGLFYKDRYVSLAAAICNAGLSVLLAYFFGVYGVLFATIIIDLCIYHIVEPYILFRYGLEQKPWKYYFTNYFAIIFFVGEVLLFTLLPIKNDNNILELLFRGLASLGINLVPMLAIYLFNTEIRNKLYRKICKKEKLDTTGDFLFVLPSRKYYYFDKLDEHRVNLVFVDEVTDCDTKKTKFLNKVSHITAKYFFWFPGAVLLVTNICKKLYGEKVVNAVRFNTGMAIMDTPARRDILFLIKAYQSDKCYLVIWNSLDDEIVDMFKKYLNTANIYSYSEADCEKFGFNFTNDFYLTDYPIENRPIEYDFYFLGRNKGRIDLLYDFVEKVKGQYRVRCDILDENANLKESNECFNYFDKFIPFEDYLKNVFSSKCLIDLTVTGNITFRTIEAMIFKKKYITNNAEIVKRDFYRKDNIMVIGFDTTVEEITKFLDTPFSEIPNEVIKRYDFYETYDKFKNLALSGVTKI